MCALKLSHYTYVFFNVCIFILYLPVLSTVLHVGESPWAFPDMPGAIALYDGY